MLFVASIWISHYSYQKTQISGFFNSPSFKINPNIILTILFGLHSIGGLTAACLEYKHPFSQGQSVAKFIKESKADEMLIAGAAPDDLTLEILGYLEKDQFYYPRTKRFGSYGTWDMKWRHGRSTPMNKVLQEVQRLSNKMDEDVIVITARPLEKKILPDIPNVKAPVEIGRAEGENYFTGSIDELLIAKRALTQEEILKHFDSGIEEAIIADPDTVLAMTFSEGEDNTTIDLSDYSNHGTLQNVKWVNGKFNRSLMLNGTAWINVEDDESLDLDKTNFTIALWVNFREKSYAAFISKDEGLGEKNKWFLSYKPSSKNNHIGFHINQPDKEGIWINTPWNGETFQWYQIVLVKKGYSYIFYVDGQKIDNVSIRPPSLHEIKRFGPSIINGEVLNYCLYQISPSE